MLICMGSLRIWCFEIFDEIWSFLHALRLPADDSAAGAVAIRNIASVSGKAAAVSRRYGSQVLRPHGMPELRLAFIQENAKFVREVAV
jgi:hypothetical protein